MSTQDKLAEALRMARDYVSDVAYDGNTVARKNVQLIDEVLQAHAAEAAAKAVLDGKERQ